MAVGPQIQFPTRIQMDTAIGKRANRARQRVTSETKKIAKSKKMITLVDIKLSSTTDNCEPKRINAQVKNLEEIASAWG